MRSSRLRLLALVIGAVALCAAAAPFAYSRLELAPLWYPIVGVDVSNHQGSIDWPKVRASGVAFAYIKATEGGDFRDKSFERNWLDSAAAGIPRGAYHFFTACKTGAEQARNFIAAVPRESAALPPVIDVEHDGPCRDGAVAADIVGEIERFMADVESHYGVRPLVYTTLEFHAAVLEGRLASETFWARSLMIEPRFCKSEWRIWQYHNWGRRPGIDGPVDLNVFRGSEADFRSFAAGSALRD
jgi:lysozyme